LKDRNSRREHSPSTYNNAPAWQYRHNNRDKQGGYAQRAPQVHDVRGQHPPRQRRESPPSSTSARHQYREERRFGEEQKPMPSDGMCNTLCPLFRCEKRALIKKLVDGKPQAFCMWVNDTCIGYKCQYAMCAQRNLLPDGKCSAALRSDRSREDAFMKELESSKDDDLLKSLLNRKGIKKDLLY